MNGAPTGSGDTQKEISMHDQALRFFQEHAVFFATVANLLGVAAGWLLRQAHVSHEVSKAASQQSAYVELLSNKLTGVSQELESAVARAEEETQRRVHTVESIVIIENDRNGWRDRYWACALGHSNLQAMLMREIVRLRGIVDRATSGKYKHSTGLAQAVDKFSEEHVAKIPPEERSRVETGMLADPVAPRAPEGVVSRPE
jgi:hypothetical protein